MSEPTYTPIDASLLNAEHTKAYRESDGEVGYLWNGVPILLLTTVGRKSGRPRTTPLIFGRDGDDYLVVASLGGAPDHPNWYLNLLEHPRAEVQVRAEHIAVTSRTATPGEKPRLWGVMRDQWPNYDVYQARTDREIPVVVLSPGGDR